MDMAELDRIAQHALAGELRLNEPMRRHVSWRAGGAADRAYFPRDLEDLAHFVRTLPRDELVWVVGLGSNLLVRDGGLRGTVVFTHRALSAIRLDAGAQATPVIYAEAGVASPKVARYAATHGLVGSEFLAGIPGTVGGALAMNAGCYGSETWDVVEAVLCLRRDGELLRRTPGDYEIGYRHVALKSEAPAAPAYLVMSDEPHAAGRAEEWFVGAWLRHARGDEQESRRVIKELLQRRIRSQPLDQPNAGSVFRNPPGDYAARLIEACGMKGMAIGGAMVSSKHANFIVNLGTASATDIERLIETIQQTVLDARGIQLEREVRIIGERQ